MSRLRYNGLATGASTATVALALGASLTNSATSVTFNAALTYNNGTAVPTLVSPDVIPLSILDSNGNLSEIVYLTAYTAGATTGTILRAQEGTTGVAHASGDKVVHAPTVTDLSAVSGTGTLPTVVGTSSVVFSGTSTNALTAPGSVVAGDLLVVMAGGNAPFLNGSGGGNATGWATLYAMTTSNHTAGLAVAVAGSTSASSTVTATFNGTTNGAHLIVVRGWTKIVSAAVFANGNLATTVAAPLENVSDTSVLCLGMASFRSSGATITGNLGTAQASGNNGANIASKSFSGPGASGLYAFIGNSTANAENAAVAIALGG